MKKALLSVAMAAVISLSATAISSTVVVPQTGGVGTVMFYILGTAFALGGIATLFIRRRVKATNK